MTRRAVTCCAPLSPEPAYGAKCWGPQPPQPLIFSGPPALNVPSTRGRKRGEGGMRRKLGSWLPDTGHPGRGIARPPSSLRPCRVHSCLHFFRVMNTLPDNRHFWKSLVSSVRNWNTTNQAPLGNPESPPRPVPMPPAEEDRGPELSPDCIPPSAAQLCPYLLTFQQNHPRSAGSTPSAQDPSNPGRKLLSGWRDFRL